MDHETDWLTLENALAGAPSPRRRIKNSRPLDQGCMRRYWLRFQQRWKLPKLSPSDFRHFVYLKCDDVRLTNSASAYYVGHDSSRGETYRNWYANLPVDDAILEQEQKIPDGILGLLRKPEIELVREMSRPLIDMVSQFMDGQIGELELALQASKIRHTLPQNAKNLEP